jgi:hypothetical protein
MVDDLYLVQVRVALNAEVPEDDEEEDVLRAELVVAAGSNGVVPVVH